MKLTQRTLIIGAVVVAVLVVLALQVIDPVFVVLALAVLALVGLVAWGRVRSRERADEEADWASGAGRRAPCSWERTLGAVGHAITPGSLGGSRTR